MVDHYSDDLIELWFEDLNLQNLNKNVNKRLMNI